MTADDHARWRELFAGYADFYRIDQTPEMADRVWSWLLDPHHELEGLVAVDSSGRAAGLAHFRRFARPSRAAVGGYLDDLYVDPAARGQGAVDALLIRLREIAAERGWTVIRWITAADNHRARSAYDRIATSTSWVTYDLDPAPSDRPVATAGDVLRFGYPGDDGLGDRLVEAVLQGHKTATSSLAVEYLSGDRLPRVGNRMDLVDSSGLVRGSIETVGVTITPMDLVGDDVARAEGENFADASEWRREHIAYWTDVTELVRADSGDPHWQLRDCEPVVVHHFRLVH